jgi:hypothetical protein
MLHNAYALILNITFITLSASLYEVMGKYRERGLREW